MLGTPAIEDMEHLFSPRAKTRLLSVTRPNSMQERLYQLSPNASHGIVHLLSRMLVFNPVSDGEGMFFNVFNYLFSAFNLLVWFLLAVVSPTHYYFNKLLVNKEVVISSFVGFLFLCL